jgi:hypothetical protein
MSYTDYRTLLNLGRKAGLTTSELYSALATRPIEGRGQGPGQADPNGFVPAYDHLGQRVYRPVGAGLESRL